MSLTDSYNTPKWIADRVGTFDLDPCSNDRTHIRARQTYALPLDGLSLPWVGRVWLNPPYSNPLPWMEKLHNERAAGRVTESLVLVKLDVSPKWWHTLTNPAYGRFDAWFFHKRLQFDPPPGVKTSSNNFSSVLIHHDQNAIAPLDLDEVADVWTKVGP